MVELIKLIPVLLHGKPAMIFAIFVAIVAFAPIDSLESVREYFGPVLPAIGALAVAVVVGNILFCLKDSEVARWPYRRLERRKRGKAFKKLSEAQKLLVLDLQFGGPERYFRFDDSKDEIRELLNEELVEQGWIDSDPGRSLQLTQSAEEFIEQDEEQKKALRKELLDKGMRGKIDEWVV